MTLYEKQLEARIGALERQIREMRAHLGMDEAEIRRIEQETEYREAIEAIGRGDTSLIKEHLKKVNGRTTATGNS